MSPDDEVHDKFRERFCSMSNVKATIEDVTKQDGWSHPTDLAADLPLTLLSFMNNQVLDELFQDDDF